MERVEARQRNFKMLDQFSIIDNLTSKSCKANPKYSGLHIIWAT